MASPISTLSLYRRRVALRIAAVCVIVGALFAGAAWWYAVERLEADTVAAATEEARRLITPLSQARGEATLRTLAQTWAASMTGGFDIVEIYDAHGTRLAEHMTEAGHRLEPLLPAHARPTGTQAVYESVRLPSGEWLLRVFAPLYPPSGAPGASHIGTVEAVRLMAPHAEAQIRRDAAIGAAAVILAALTCGMVLYPIVIHLSRDNEAKALQVLQAHVAIIEAMGRAIARRDSETGAHNYRVAWLATRLGEQLGLPAPAMQGLIIGSFLHDVGKIGIPDAILLKPGRLTEDEWRTMREHVTIGESIVQGIPWMAGSAEVVACHHEKWDGSGYPRGLAGEEIPLSARIFAIADVFDALTSRRPYKEPMPLVDTLRVLRDGRGRHFDPELIDVFLGLATALHAQLKDLDEEGCRNLLNDRIFHHFGLK